MRRSTKTEQRTGETDTELAKKAPRNPETKNTSQDRTTRHSGKLIREEQITRTGGKYKGRKQHKTWRW